MVCRANDPWRGSWDVPGGFCEEREHPAETAQREVLEETGLAIRITGLLGMWLDTYGDGRDGKPPETTLNIYYHAVPAVSEAQVEVQPDEVQAARWFLPAELPQNIAFPHHIGQVLTGWRRWVEDGHPSGPTYDVTLTLSAG